MGTFFPKETLDEIRNRASIVAVVSDYVSLKKAGKNYQGLCPFHNEKTPSFSVNEEKQVFYCFGCQKGGNVISFYKEINNISFVEAVTRLAEQHNVRLPETSRKQDGKLDNRDALIRVNEKALAYFHSVLMERPEGKTGRDYLEKRRIERDVWSVFSLGYAPDRWDGLTSFLSSENIPLNSAKLVGLVASRKGGGYYDYFRGRIIFPIKDYSGRPIGFGGRTLKDKPPKYLNSPDSAVYRKSYSVFGLPITREPIAQDNRVLIVEGYFDLLSLYQAGIRSVVSPLGTALTQGHIQALKRYSGNFYLLFDADEAGEKAAARSLALFLDEGLSPQVVIMPPGTDPDDVIKAKGPDFFREKIAEAPFLIDFFIDKTISKHDIARPDGKSAVIKEVMPTLNRIDDPIVQSEHLRVLAERLGVREDDVRRFARGSQLSGRESSFSFPKNDRKEAFLLAMVLQRPAIIPVLNELGVFEDLNNPDLKALGKKFVEAFEDGQELDVAGMLAGLQEKQRSLVTQLSVKEQDFGDLEASLRDCVRQIKRNKIKENMVQLTQQMRKAQEQGNIDEIHELNRRQTLLIRQEKDLNSSNWILEQSVSF